MKNYKYIIKTSLLFLIFGLSLLLSSCGIELPEEMLSDYKLKVTNTITNETIIYNFKEKEIYISDVTISYIDGYDFVCYALDKEGTSEISSSSKINLNRIKKIYSIWEVQEEIPEEPAECSYDFTIDEIGRVDLTATAPIINKEDYVTGTIKITSNSYNLDTTNMKIRLRGNSTLSAPKKAYKIKFDAKVDIFNFGANKEWCLLANYYDTSLVRNYYAYNFAKAIGIDYSVDCKFVEVYLNGENQGLYLLCETVKTGSTRVDIETDYTEADTEIPFLLEFDQTMTYEDTPDSNGVLDVDYFRIEHAHFKFSHYAIGTKYPDDFTTNNITAAQYNYIKTTVTTAYDSIFKDDDSYANYYDVESIIKYFIVQELFMNIDLDYSSVYFYKPLNDKIHYGPIWDFDISVGNANYYAKYGPEMGMKDVNQGSLFINTLLEKESFHKEYMKYLAGYEKYVEKMLSSFTSNYNKLKEYEERDNQIWNNLNKSYWPKPSHLVGITYKEQVNYVKNYLNTHYQWMLENM